MRLYNNNLSTKMFPQIAKRKKKEFVVEEAVSKQWEDAMRDLDIRSKAALRRLPPQLLQDFSKVCRVKSIPEFYANYFICSSQRVDGAALSQIYAEEIQKLLTNGSHFHKINQALRQREELIQGLKKSLIIVEGFLLMNQNKPLPLPAKTSIDGLVDECGTLQELKDLERRKTEALAKDIIRIRTNTTQLIELVQQWRSDLQRMSGVEGRKIIPIYPHQAINCLLMPLYDLLFLRESPIKTEISFGRDQHDPFLENISRNKKGTQIQQYILDYLKADTTDYSPFTAFILQEFPSDQNERMRDKELELEQRKEERAKEQKLKEEKLKAMREEREKNLRIRRHSSLRNVKQKDTLKEGQTRFLNIKTSKGDRSERKVINIDTIIRDPSKKNKDKSKNQPLTDSQSKVIAPYKKSNKKQPMEQSTLIQREEVMQQKRLWQKSIKEEKQQKQKIRKLLKQTQKKALQQTKQFEIKLKRYQQEVHNLKSRIEQSKKSRIPSAKQFSSPSKQRSVLSVYKSERSEAKSKVGGGISMLQSRLQQESNTKRNLQKQIKDLVQEKQRLEKIINRENMKSTKQIEANKRQMETYEEVIYKLKNQSEESRKIILELELSKASEERRQAEELKSSSVKQKEESRKKIISDRMKEKEVISKVQQEKKEPFQKSRSQKRKSLGNSAIEKLNSSHVRASDPNIDVLKSQLEEESRAKRSLQTQIKELAQQKLKLQKWIERQSFKSAKESEKYSKRIEKYEETINRLKKQSEDSRRVISEIETSRIAEQKRNIERSKAESISRRQEEMKQKILEKIADRQKRKEAQKERQLQESKVRRSPKNHTMPASDDVEIIKTKQTIEIVFEPRRKRSHPNKDLVEAESKLIRLEKERELLEKKLQLTIADKTEKVQQSKKRENQRSELSDKFRGQIEKEKNRNEHLDQAMKKMRASISNEFQLRLNQEKLRHEKQRQELLRVIEKERQEKRSKDKILEQQMAFLREMERKEEELFQLLQSEKMEKLRKEQILAQQMQQKEELISLLEIQEIKKNIQREVRKQIEQEDSEDDDQDFSHQQKKAQLEQEIEQLRIQQEQEIEQMNNQNLKLKQLIADLKSEETHLLEAIRQNIEMESDNEHQAPENNQPQSQPEMSTRKQSANLTSEKKEELTLEQIRDRNQQLTKELQFKTALQFSSEQKKKQKYANIIKTDQFHQKQKVQNLVELYLKSPQKYPGQEKIKLTAKDKQVIIQESSEKAKKIEQFQSELFSLRELPDFVPSLKNDSVTGHLLHLREAYEDYQADSLRRELFPPLEDEVYGEKELPMDDEEPPMNTLMDEVRAHLNKHPNKKDEKNKKNFLAINRVRLAVLEDARKEKQRQMIEEESRKKIQRELFEKRRKQREENFIREREKENEMKEKKREEAYRRERNRIQKEKLEEQKKKEQKSKEKHHKNQIKKQSQQKIKRQRLLSKQADDEPIHKQPKREQKVENHSQPEPKPKQESEKQKNINQIQKHEKDIPPQILQAQDVIVTIKQEQSLELQEAELAEQVQQYEQDLKKRERELLKSEVKQVQEEVRAYIKEEEQFSVYQQFVNETQLLSRIQEILDLSSSQIKSLNGNQTLIDDVQQYPTLSILVAKSSKGLQIGLAVFHKEFQGGQYICDYLVAHRMENFLNLAFNFSRFLFQNDPYAQKIEFIFDIKSLTDAQTLKHFLQFEKRCRRLGEVYVKARSETQRKYVLRRPLFQAEQEKPRSENGGLNFNLNLALCGNVLTQINLGYKNETNLNYSSFNVILAYYLSRKEKKLQHFRQRAESQLIYRQLLVTSLLFQKKELQIKNFILMQRADKDLGSLIHLKDKFDLADVEELDEMALQLTEKLPKTCRRCTLQVGMEQVNYLLLSPDEAITSIQSSNSSETGFFLSVLPKYKMMVIQAQEFLSMSAKNPSLTAFFYIKHFIKNIVDVKKEKFQRVYLPEVHLDNEFHLADISKRLGETTILSEKIQIGWKSHFSNSVIYTPRHQDLVIQRPFIVALLSGSVERAVQGSPICVQLVSL